MPEQLTGLEPHGTDFKSAGRSTVRGVDAAHLSACLADCTPIQELILLSKANGVQPKGKGLELLHLRVCKMMVREKWEISKRDSKRKALLLLTTLGLYVYCAHKPPMIKEIIEYMGVSRSQWHKKWANKYKTMMDDFNEYLSEQERDGNRAFYRLYMDEY